MIRALALAITVTAGLAMLIPSPASAVCECYHKGVYKGCSPSATACRAEGGNHCYIGCRRN